MSKQPKRMTQKEFDAMVAERVDKEVQRRLERMEHSPALGQIYSGFREMQTALGTSNIINQGLKNEANAFLRSAPQLNRMLHEVLTWGRTWRLGILGFSSSYGEHNWMGLLKLCAVLFSVVGGIYVVMSNPETARGVNLWMSSPANQFFLLVGLIVVAVIVYLITRRKNKPQNVT